MRLPRDEYRTDEEYLAWRRAVASMQLGPDEKRLLADNRHNPDMLQSFLAVFGAIRGIPAPEPTAEEYDMWHEQAMRRQAWHRYICAQNGRFYGPDWNLIDEAIWRETYGDPWEDCPADPRPSWEREGDGRDE